jgi:ACS family tartrate transporter-like MFS transporter
VTDAANDDLLGRATIARVSWRIIPLLCLGYLIAYMDRVNIGFAAVRMNADLHFSETIYGLGGGLFFLSYALFEVPSNILLVKVGARRWIARIMISWGLLAVAMMLVRTPMHFYLLRFLLGAAEAGFFPGVIYYLACWFPLEQRGRAISRFYIAGPLTSVVMGAISGALLGLDGRAGLHGWQWLFLVQGMPAIFTGLIIWRFLPEAPEQADWLPANEKAWLTEALAADAARLGPSQAHGMLAALRDPVVLQLGAIGFLAIGAFYAFTLSAPKLLIAGTGWDVTHVGYLVLLGGLLGAATILIAGVVTDRAGERFTTFAVSLALLGIAYLVLGLGSGVAVIVPAYLLFAAAWTPVTVCHVLLWTDLLPPQKRAVGCAAINSMSQIGAAVSPFLWGWAKDATGSYAPALCVLAAMMALAFALVLRLRANAPRSVARDPLKAMA